MAKTDDPTTTSAGAMEAAKEFLVRSNGRVWLEELDDLAEIIDRLAVQPKVMERDIEWCKMLGHPEAGAVGNTPEFMQRELDAMEDLDAADHVRCRNRLATAEARERALLGVALYVWTQEGIGCECLACKTLRNLNPDPDRLRTALAASDTEGGK